MIWLDAHFPLYTATPFQYGLVVLQTRSYQMTSNHEIASDLLELYEQIKDMVQQAERLVENTPAYERARGYWIAQMRCALDDDHGYMGRGMCTMRSTIEELEVQDEREAEDDGRVEGDEYSRRD
jgi:hypothetical protein